MNSFLSASKSLNVAQCRAQSKRRVLLNNHYTNIKPCFWISLFKNLVKKFGTIFYFLLPFSLYLYMLNMFSLILSMIFFGCMFVEAMYRNIFYVFSRKFTKPKEFSQKFWFGGVAACYLRFRFVRPPRLRPLCALGPPPRSLHLYAGGGLCVVYWLCTERLWSVPVSCTEPKKNPKNIHIF